MILCSFVSIQYQQLWWTVRQMDRQAAIAKIISYAAVRHKLRNSDFLFCF